jgi:phosphoglycolate phosphatase-like HAD superfamily hydrolase
LFIGDMVVDIETARSAGVPVIVLPTGSHTPQQLKRGRPDLILKRFSDLPGTLLRPWLSPASRNVDFRPTEVAAR